VSSTDGPQITDETTGLPAGRSRVTSVSDLLNLTRGLVSLWPTTLTFLAGVLATLGVWMLAETYPKSERSRALAGVANGMRQVLEVRLNDHLRGLQLASEVWPRFATDDPTRWKLTAQMFLQQHPGVVLIALVPADAPLTSAVSGASPAADGAGSPPKAAAEPAEPATELVARDPGLEDWKFGSEVSARLEEAQRRAVSEQRTSMDGPYAAASGQVFYQIVIPLHAEDRPSGLLCALIHPGPLIASLVSELASGYFLAVRDDGALVYMQGTPPPARPSNELDEDEAAELPLRLLLGRTWTLDLERPDALGLSPLLTLGHLVLGAGLAFSVLLAGVVHLGQVARVRARALAIANRELRSQIVSTAVAEGRVRRINESLEARVAERTRELDEVVAELETFNYSVSHDLRSPIGAIVNFTSILAEDYKDKLDDAGVDILRRVAGCAQNAVAMMDGLLTFSHIGQQALTLGTLDTRQMLDSVIAELLLAHRGTPPTFTIGPLPDVVADAPMLRTVWTNLLSNALKFTESSPEAAVEVGSQPASGEDVFFVRDNGVGFDMKHASRLFNVFEQLHPGAKSKGHGVGLAIVSRIVRRHGGRVWAQAAPGKGATFYFSIPKQAA
jgi:signal transduction histidine kinase